MSPLRRGSLESQKNQVLTGLRSIALFEALKGTLVLLIGFGLLALLSHDLQSLGERIVAHLHMNPAHHYPQIFIQSLVRAENFNRILLALGAALYSTLRFIEAYGLWFGKVWAEWIAILSTGAYLPFEFFDIYEKPTALRIGISVLNIALLIYLIKVRRKKMLARSANK